MFRKIVLLIAVLTIAASLSACVDSVDTRGGVDLGTDDVDQRFQAFYDLLGGVDVLGPAISPKFSNGGNEYQYTATALMVFAPGAPDSQQYQLAALGVELGIAELSMDPNAPNGPEIYYDFIDLYTKMGGARFVGLPITEMRHNLELGRVEQYFENVGFYQSASDPAGEVHLLHYGSWKCADVCGFKSPQLSVVSNWSIVGASFVEAVQRLDPTFTGLSLTNPYTAFDGLVEQIFENVVVITDPSNPGGISLRPIVGMLNNLVVTDAHYDVPEFFLEFLSRNSGLELSGPPVSEYTPLGDDIFRQCFTNLCLDYYPNAPESLRVRPTPLGYTYKNLYYQSGSDESSSNSLHEVTLQVWERYPLIASDQVQEIGVGVFDGTTPLKNIEPVLTLTLPDAGDASYTFPPTRDDGKSHLELGPISALNGTRIEYKVCITSLNNDIFCIKDDFMIWGNP